jgi:hypothetical protein
MGLCPLQLWHPLHRFLSSGNSYLDCGHPCEKSTVHLRDHQGQDHLVLADMGCRWVGWACRSIAPAGALLDLAGLAEHHAAPLHASMLHASPLCGRTLHSN